MPNRTHYQRILDLAGQRGMLRARDLDTIGAPRVALARLTASGQLEKVARGVYRRAGSHGSEHESFAAVAAKVPQAVFCLLQAPQQDWP